MRTSLLAILLISCSWRRFKFGWRAIDGTHHSSDFLGLSPAIWWGFPPSHKWQARVDDCTIILPEELRASCGLRHGLDGIVPEGWIIEVPSGISRRRLLIYQFSLYYPHYAVPETTLASGIANAW
mmetsp:Transcript_41809/g.119987  ORF Transcript_41809/g.119987 Transcript_41809/m.119987 type:complete len:125 (-) Transcript_41809:12-386(-)